ncbi:DUF262 domain-containing protein [Rhodanobacter denitrificans]|uniref:DUF262 domain-containing protein n=1 Tax=Rhodanobacter denitrificans TaxID=666685 RepID=UPI001F43BF4B|nr:DUF262 domain-containing protein [Rhodanobacter denitrificans]UJJ60618.1 DUF262 domain-containing protein [Rhodanobacter denitrificans]
MSSSQAPISPDELVARIRPLSVASYAVDYSWSLVERMLVWLAEGSGAAVELNPDFQRGHVWTESQQQAFIENALRGVIDQAGFAIRFNAPAWESDPVGDLDPTVQCMDGLQRLTAVRRFIAGAVRPFGLHVDQLKGSPFRVAGASSQFRFRVMVYTFQWRADLLQHYLDLNAGGTPHSREELERVRAALLEVRRPTQAVP